MIRRECIDAIAQTVGRALTTAELHRVETLLSKHMHMAARANPEAQRAMPLADRWAQAAESASMEVLHEAAKTRQRVELTILKHGQLTHYVETAENKANAVADLLAPHPSIRTNVMSIHTRAEAIESLRLSEMEPLLLAARPTVLGIFGRGKMARDIVRELFGESTGNKEAAEAAKNFSDTAEKMRTDFNRFGGDVRKLMRWALPQGHDQVKIAEVGRDAWVNAIAPLLDRRMYVHEDGRLMTDLEYRDFLGEAWLTLSMDGANKSEPGAYQGNGMVAKRHAAERQLHFKDADSYLKYHESFAGRSLYETIIGHVRRMATDIALVQELGPHPAQMADYLIDLATHNDMVAQARDTGVVPKGQHKGKTDQRAGYLHDLYDVVARNGNDVVSAKVMRAFEVTRDLLSSAYLGSTAITSLFTDPAFIAVTAHQNNIPQLKMWGQVLKQLNPLSARDRRIARRSAVAMQVWANEVTTRFGSELKGTNWSRLLATATLKLSGALDLWEGQKQAFGVMLQDTLASVAREHKRLADLDEYTHRTLTHKGLSETDWAVWRMAKPEAFGGSERLTPKAIYAIPDERLQNLGDPAALKEEASIKLIGVVNEEMHHAITEPSPKDTLFLHGRGRRGTVGSELKDSMTMFLSFPVSVFNRHIMRALNMPRMRGKAGYLAAIIVGSTLGGMMSNQARSIANGKDPADMLSGKAVAAGFMRAGAFGLYAQFLFSDVTGYGSSLQEEIAGPVMGLVNDVLRITQGAAYGTSPHPGADAVRFARGHIPVINLWYTKAALNHMIFYHLEEYFSPGYLRRMKRRSRRVYGQRYWWEPQDRLPDRAPDWSAAVGEK